MLRTRSPRIKVDFVTDDNIFTVRYTADVNVKGSDIGDKILSFQSKNSMQDDSAVYEIILASDIQWDRILNVNDITKIYIDPNDTDIRESSSSALYQDNAYKLVVNGMISQVSKVGDYGVNKTIYRITGQSFSKPFIKFGLGVIQEVQAVLPSTGWLVDGEPIAFTGKNAKEIMKSVLDYFVPKMKYQFRNGKNGSHRDINSHFTYTLDSWTEYENLTDATQLSNFDGSLKQMMDLITARPFNENFFRNSKDEAKTEFVLRRTPFNPADWVSLDYELISSQDIVAEDVGKSDVETFSIFTVTTPKMLKEMSQDLFSIPQYHEQLVARYGYSKLQVENMYAVASVGATQEEDDKNKNPKKDKGIRKLTYDRLMNDLKGYGQENVTQSKNSIATQLAGTYVGLKKAMAVKLVDTFSKTNNVSKQEFQRVTGLNPEDTGENDTRPKPTKTALENILKSEFKTKKDFEAKDIDKKKQKAYNKVASTFRYGNKILAKKLVEEYVKYFGKLPNNDAYNNYINDTENIHLNAVDTGTDASDSVMLTFSKMLFNWFYNNPNFFSGDITVVGHPRFDIGKRLVTEDALNKSTWEYYIESVEHNFSYQKGYFTVLGVTRGLSDVNKHNKYVSRHRFGNLWSQSKDFKGGLLGEKILSEMKSEAVKAREAKGSDESSGGSVFDKDEYSSEAQQKALAYMRSLKGKAIDFDGAYGLQCMDVSVDYAHHISGGKLRLAGNANNIHNNSFPPGWELIPYRKGYIPPVGSIVEFGGGFFSGYGHTGLVWDNSGGADSFTILEQNWDSRANTPAKLREDKFQYVKYFLIPPMFTDKARAEAKKKAKKGGGHGGSGSLSDLQKYNGVLPEPDKSISNSYSDNPHYPLQCTWYCWKRRMDLGVPLPKRGWGDAWEWKEESRKVGYSGGTTPRIGAIVVWQRNKQSPLYGHVAIVEAVYNNGKNIDISEYNYVAPETYGERTLSVTGDMYFIYD